MELSRFDRKVPATASIAAQMDSLRVASGLDCKGSVIAAAVSTSHQLFGVAPLDTPCTSARLLRAFVVLVALVLVAL